MFKALVRDALVSYLETNKFERHSRVSKGQVLPDEPIDVFGPGNGWTR